MSKTKKELEQENRELRNDLAQIRETRSTAWEEGFNHAEKLAKDDKARKRKLVRDNRCRSGDFIIPDIDKNEYHRCMRVTMIEGGEGREVEDTLYLDILERVEDSNTTLAYEHIVSIGLDPKVFMRTVDASTTWELRENERRQYEHIKDNRGQ